MKQIVVHVLFLLLFAMVESVFAANNTSDYAVVVSKKTLADEDWKKVTDVLVKKHHATVVTFEADVNETLPELRRQFPRYVCFGKRQASLVVLVN